MAVYTINQTLQVVDLKDGKPYPREVAKVDEENAKIEVHVINWNEKYNEWIEFGSKRIVDPNQNDHIVQLFQIASSVYELKK